jgi:hypothetical protein
MCLGHPVLKVAEMRYVAEQVARVELWLYLVQEPSLSISFRADLLADAHRTIAYLAAYTQPWIVAHE